VCERRRALPPTARASAVRIAFHWLVALAGLALFAYLVATSGITLELLGRLGAGGFGLLLLVAAAVQVLDTVGWYCAVRHLTVAGPHPRPLKFFAMRVAGDSLTNALPGGVVLGETYKAAMMKRVYGVSIADNAATLLTVKFALALSQSVFILGGLALSYSLLRDHGLAALGVHHTELVAVALTVGFGLLLGWPLVAMARGHAFAGTCRALARLPIPPLRRALERSKLRIEALDQACTQVLRGNRRNLLLAFLAILCGWVIMAGESYVLLRGLGLSRSLRDAFVIESVGSIFRMILFILPSGIGAQDASFVALFKLEGFPGPAAGAFVLLKRCKELVWIGLGFVLLLVLRRTAPAPATALTLEERDDMVRPLEREGP
jgi:glycosyltransferase 2 family protein